MSIKKEGYTTAILFILPAFVVYMVFWVYPLGYLFYLSFHQWALGLGSIEPVGWRTYLELLSDEYLLNALENTLVYTLITVPLFVALSLALALLVNRHIPGIAAFRAAYYLPVVTSLVAVGVIWTWLYDADHGIVNLLLSKVGIPPVAWLNNTATALPSVAFVQVWQRVGFYMVIFLAGLQGIPHVYYEAAMIDGAGWWTRFRTVTVPGLSEITILVLIVSAIQSWKMSFAIVHVMTGGGPLKSTELMLNYLYDRAFRAFEIGYSSAVAIVIFAVLLCLTLVQWKFHSWRANR